MRKFSQLFEDGGGIRSEPPGTATWPPTPGYTKSIEILETTEEKDQA